MAIFFSFKTTIFGHNRSKMVVLTVRGSNNGYSYLYLSTYRFNYGCHDSRVVSTKFGKNNKKTAFRTFLGAFLGLIFLVRFFIIFNGHFPTDEKSI